MTNIHTHLFTMDHIPAIQVVYMVKDIIIGILKTLPFDIVIGDVDKRDKIPLLNLLTPFLSSRAQGALDSMLAFFVDVSDISYQDLVDHSEFGKMFNGNGKLTLRLLVRYMRRRMRDGANFEQILIDLVTILYQINNASANKTRDHASVLKRLLTSIPDHPYDRLVVLSIDFDRAFEHVYNPGFGSVAEIGFNFRVPAIGFGAPGASPPGRSQISELAKLTVDAAQIAQQAGYESNLKLIPFFGVDPRSYASGQAAREAVEGAMGAGYCGVKIYPPMGYLPDNPRLQEVFSCCTEEGLPVMTHCGRGGAGRKGPANCSDFAHPYHWMPVLNRISSTYGGQPLPNGKFRVCLAHFDSLRFRDEVAWWDEIIRLVELYHDNDVVQVYVDVAANHPKRGKQAREYFGRLKMVFENRKTRESLLFGTDWWMQLSLFEETDFIERYFDEYELKEYYPEGGSGSGALKQLFEDNAQRYLGKWY